jgi:hypothetical protein
MSIIFNGGCGSHLGLLDAAIKAKIIGVRDPPKRS